jgi:hypothetical protein
MRRPLQDARQVFRVRQILDENLHLVVACMRHPNLAHQIVHLVVDGHHLDVDHLLVVVVELQNLDEQILALPQSSGRDRLVAGRQVEEVSDHQKFQMDCSQVAAHRVVTHRVVAHQVVMDADRLEFQMDCFLAAAQLDVVA